MVDEQDYQYLISELAEYFRRSPPPITTAADNLFTPDNLIDLIDSLVNDAPRPAAVRTIGYCQRQSPPGCIRLLRRLMRLLTQTKVLESISARIDTWQDELDRGLANPAAPFEAVVVGGHLPFIDRGPGRKVLQQLLKGNGRMIGSVEGPTRCGKSYTYHLINHVAASEMNVRCVYVPVTPVQAPDFSPDELAHTIIWQATGVEPTLPERLSQVVNQRVPQLATWIKDKIAPLSIRLWIVLDGFGHPDLPKPILNLIEQLAVFMQMSVLGQDRKLVLLGAAKKLSPGIAASMLEDPLPDPETSIGEADLFDFFRRWLRDRNPALADPGAAATLNQQATERAKGVLDFIAATSRPDGVDRLTWINLQVSKVIAP